MTPQKKEYLEKAFEVAKAQYLLKYKMPLVVTFKNWLKTKTGKAASEYYDKNIKAKVESGRFNVGEYLSSPEGASTINSLTNLFSVIAGKGNIQQSDTYNLPDDEVDEDDDQKETKILWMTPVTFAIVTITSLLVIGGIITFVVLAKRKNAATLVTAAKA